MLVLNFFLFIFLHFFTVLVKQTSYMFEGWILYKTGKTNKAQGIAGRMHEMIFQKFLVPW